MNIEPAPIPNLNTVDQCRDKCESYGGACKGWTLTEGKCYVKSSVGSMRYDAYVTASGYCFPADGPSSLGSSGAVPSAAVAVAAASGSDCGGAWSQNNNDGVNIEPAPIPNLNTVDQCRDKCESYGGACKGWTLTEGKCYVKSSVGSMRYDAYVTASGYCFPADGPSSLGSSGAVSSSAVAVAVASGSDCGGAWSQNNNDGVNIEPAPIPNLNTVDQCRDKCESYGGACKGWTLTEGKCYVKSSVGSMRYDAYVTASGYCFPADGPSSLGSGGAASSAAVAVVAASGSDCGGAWSQNNNDGVNIEPAPIPNLNTVDQCRDKCESYGGACKGWTLTEGKCYVKSSVGSMRYDAYVTASGYCFPADGPSLLGSSGATEEGP